MSTTAKSIISLFFLLLALAAGLYVAGYLTLLLLDIPAEQMVWNRYWHYLNRLDLPAYAAVAEKIKLAGAIGFGVPALLWFFLTVAMFRSNNNALHGEARFAKASDLSKNGLFKPGSRGIVVGQYGGKLLRLSGQQFVILAAPTRSGKGVGIVVPNLLEYGESMVVLDIKQENFDLTSGWRAKQGQKVFLFNPFAEDLRSHRWNPLSYVSKDPAFRISDLQKIAAMLYPDAGDRDRFWVGQARNAFIAFALYAFEYQQYKHETGFDRKTIKPPSLGMIYRLSTPRHGESKPYVRDLSEKPFLSDNARSAFTNLLSQADKTYSSIIGFFQMPLNAWLNPILDAATSGDDFWLDDLRKQKMTIYIGIQPNKLAEARLILNLFFSQLINVNTTELPQDNPELKYQCLLLMDEFTAIGKIDIVSDAVAYMAGYNLRLLPIIQSMAQLDAVYGKESSRNLMTNHAMQIVFAPREQRDANDYSQMLGTTTVKRNQISRGSDVTRSEVIEKRALMLPQELKALGQDTQVFFYEGIPHPVKCKKIKYYKNKYFTQRLSPKIEIGLLQIAR